MPPATSQPCYLATHFEKMIDDREILARLRDLGWIDGRNIRINDRWAGNNFDVLSKQERNWLLLRRM
jgi:hypothetical protein